MLRRIEELLPRAPVAAIFVVILYEAIFEKAGSSNPARRRNRGCRCYGGVSRDVVWISCRSVDRKPLARPGQAVD